MLVLIGLIVLAIPLAVIYLLIAVSRLKAELRDLKALMRQPGGGTARAETAVVQKTPDFAQQTPPAASAPGANVQETPETVQAERAADTKQSAVVQKTPPSVPEQPSAPWGKTDPTRPRAPSEPGLVAKLTDWLRENWFYAVSALSLALAGVFLVQYGIETGLLTPTMRVLAALALGAALIAAGETIRRRFGDGENSATAYLPSVLSGAGLVSVFGGVLAARMLYDLIGPGPAFAGLVAVTALGLVLGWLTGPLLAATALLGGFAAPFLVGGSSDSLEWLMGYFALLSALGLGIDTLRRWVWVSVLSLALGFGAGWMLWAGGGSESLGAAYAALGLALTVMAILIPARAFWPDHAGPCLSGFVAALTPDAARPIFPVMLAAGATAAASAVLLAIAPDSQTLFWIAAFGCMALAALFILWARSAPGLADLAALPAAALLLLIVLHELHGPVQAAMEARALATETQTETRMALDISLLFAFGVFLSVFAAWRSLTAVPHGTIWARAAALFAPVAGLALELSWQPSQTIGTWPWALHALGLAALMTAFAERYARRDGADRLRTALAVMSALATLAFACTVLLTSAALTLALAVTVLVAAALDRRFDLPPMEGFFTAGVVALGYRLGFDPGLDWATRAPVLEMLAAYGGSTALLVTALVILPDRPRGRVLLESAAWAAGGMTLSLGLYHLIEAFSETQAGTAHWQLGLYGTIWTTLALVQLERLRLGGRLRYVRILMAAVFGLTALAALLGAALPANPLLDRQEILGPAILNTLLAAYLLPALVLGAGALRLRHLPGALRVGLAGMAGVLSVLWVGLALRHLWRGSAEMVLAAGTTQPELYSYTVALLLVGAVLFYQALARRSDRLRRVGTLVIALAVAKVFFDRRLGPDGSGAGAGLPAAGALAGGAGLVEPLGRAKSAGRLIRIICAFSPAP
jgi:uncharacterized membrane protein